MGSETKITTPVAILAGSVVIALGLYLGLRDRAPGPAGASDASTQASSGAAVTPGSSAAAPATSAQPPAPAAADAAAAQGAARKALQAQRATLLDKCWKPTAAKHVELQSARLMVNASFDAAGTQRARGVSEVRGTGHPELTQCVGTTLQPLVIPAPGAPVMVEMELTLP